jgi:ribose-phosphate pyrophosphokinase
MKLNLIHAERSDIEYKITKFSDGQQTLELVGWNEKVSGGGIYSDPIEILMRIKSFRDLEILICAVKIIRNIEPDRKIDLRVPYFLGARSDRRFTPDGVNYLKQVICPIINSLNFNEVEVLDPHSDVLEACLENFKKKDNKVLVKLALRDLLTEQWKAEEKEISLDNWILSTWVKNQNIVLVSPDAGALKKIYDVASHFSIKNVVTAGKVRDVNTGKILKTEVPNLPISITEEEFKYVIIDDICDGGRTFIELAKAIKEQRPNAKVYLVVTHGIFSNSFYELSKHIDKIYSTNSYSDIDVESHSDYTVSNGYLYQQDIFKW